MTSEATTVFLRSTGYFSLAKHYLRKNCPRNGSSNSYVLCFTDVTVTINDAATAHQVQLTSNSRYEFYFDLKKHMKSSYNKGN